MPEQLQPMKRPFSLWILVFWLVFLAFGGLYGGITMLLDPSGKLLGVESLLGQLPISNFILPGLFLLLVMGLKPLFIAFGLIFRPNWGWANTLTRWSGHHWGWSGTLALGIVLLLWLAAQALLIGFTTGIQYIMVINALALVGLSFLPAIRNLYQVR